MEHFSERTSPIFEFYWISFSLGRWNFLRRLMFYWQIPGAFMTHSMFLLNCVGATAFVIFGATIILLIGVV